MAILRIKDENGNWINIPSIKGDTGQVGPAGDSVYICWGESSTPTQLLTTPNEYIGIAWGDYDTAPATYDYYKWYKYKGDKGTPGNDGTDGISAYVHIRWWNPKTPNELLTTPDEYIGIAWGPEEGAPTTYDNYHWYQYKGDKGDKGEPGVSAYVHIRWGTSETPSELLTVPNEYIGIASGDGKDAPGSYRDYKWYKYKGDKGDVGPKGDTGVHVDNTPPPENCNVWINPSGKRAFSNWVGTQAEYNAIATKDDNTIYFIING